MNVSDLIENSVKETLSARKGMQFYEKLAEPEIAVRMSYNENMLVDKSFSNTILMEASENTDARKYPVVKGGLALKAISGNMGFWEDEVIVGNGSDEILDLVAKVFVGRGEGLIVDPTFEMYRFYTKLAGGKTKQVLITKDFELKAEDVLSAVSEKTKAIFVCSPNNPTGKQFSRDEVLRVVEESDRLVVLDEAYVDFAPYNLVRRAAKYHNLLILRTFSKAFGLAGLRIGYGVGNSEIIEWLRAAQSPFSVNSVAQEACRLVLENKRVYESFVKRTIEERKYLTAELEMVNGIKPFESDANFILVKVIGGDVTSEDLCKRLRGAGIEVRDRGNLPMLDNCLRVTVADRESNLKFVKELEKAMKG
jgi:histidinol-phosphate aminotransferase